MTTCSPSCGTSPRDVLPPNPLRDADENTASHRDNEANRPPTTWPERQDAQSIRERHYGTKKKKGTGEVTVETATAGRVGNTRCARHRERRGPQDGAPEWADEVAGDEDGHRQLPEYESPDLSARQIALIRRGAAIGHGQPAT